MDPGARRFASIVVAAMLLSMGLLSAVMLLPRPEGEDDEEEEEDPGWSIEQDSYGEWIYVYDHVTWSGWDQVMPRPVLVGVGVTLTIEDSHLRVPLESMVSNEMSPFQVEWAGKLVLRNTTVEVEADPRLETALLNPYSYERDAPVLWRVVNLRGATEPVLEFDFELMRGWSHLVVAAQMTPDDPLVPLEVVEPDEVEMFQWTTLSVSLADYAGGTPRVAVFLHHSSPRDLMVSDIRVTDGGSPLPGDVRSTGDLSRDGWTLENLVDFRRAVSYGDLSINPLISCHGDLRMEDSRVLSLPGLEREFDLYRPQGPGDEVTAWKTPEEGCINVTGGLTLLSSEVAYAPVKWTGYPALLEGCTFSGDCDLVTLAGWNASVRDCDFAFETREGLWSPGLADAETWMLALENLGDRLLLEGCTFTGEGEGIGLALNGAWVLIKDCSFSDLALGIWDHMSMMPMSWAGLDPSVSFFPSCDLYYLETRELYVELNGPDEPTTWDRGYSYFSRFWLDQVPGLEDLYMMEERDDHFSRFALPIMVVGPVIGEVSVRQLNLTVRPRWTDYPVSFTMDPHENRHVLWIPKYGGPPDHQDHNIFGDWSLDVGEEEGVIRVGLHISRELQFFINPYLNVSIDGELVDRVDLDRSVDNGTEYYAPLVVDQAVPPGAHNLTVTAGATYPELGWVLELDRLIAWVYRASGEGSAEEAREWLTDRSLGALMVDGGTHLEGFSYAGEGELTSMSFHVLTWEGARVDVDRLHANTYWSRVSLAGNGTVTVRDLEVYSGSLAIKNVTAEIEDLTFDYFTFLGVFDADVRITGTVETNDLYADVWNGTRLVLEGVEAVIRSHLSLTVLNSQCSLGNSTFSTSGPGELVLGTVLGSRLSLEGCEFVDVPLDVDLYDVNDTVSITGCTFSGGRARLTVLPSEWVSEMDPQGQVPVAGTISGNVMSGPGADLVVHTLVRDRLLGENQLVDGARAYVLFDLKVVIQSESRLFMYNATTLDSFVYQSSGPVSRNRDNNRLNFLVDVTEDPLDMTDPGMVPVVLRINWNAVGPEGGVVGFAQVPVGSPRYTVVFVDWEPMDDAIVSLGRDIDTDDNWWTD